MTKEYRNKLTCSICGRRHPTPLHDESKIRKPDDDAVRNTDRLSAGKDKGAGIVGNSCVNVSCAMAIVPVRIKSKYSAYSVLTHAFLDSGSSISLCTDRIMHKLGLTGKRSNITLQTMGNPYEMSSVVIDNLQISDIAMTHFIDLPQIFTKNEMPVSKTHIPTLDEIRKWPHLANVDIQEIDEEIGLLIGNNVPDAYSPFEVLTGPSGSPHGTRTRIGWIVWNILRDTDAHEVNRVAIESFSDSDAKLEEMLRNSINIDFPERIIDDKAEHSVEDKNFLNQVRSSIVLENEHYSIALPLRNQSVKMPNNIAQAKQRLKGIEKKFRKDEKFKKDYVDFMGKWFENNYAEEVPEEDLSRDDGRVWYIPHHGIYHQKKPDKIRVVFDCSASYMATSLNDQLLQGPDLANNLLGVLLRFRRDNIAVQGDIEAMFLQVHIPRQDRDLMRFLWWQDGNLDKEPSVYRMKVHTFGATSSPSCCNFTLKYVAKEHESEYDDTVIDAVNKNMYVDDCLVSLNTVEEAKSFIKDISSLCKKGGFRLNKWISNGKEVLKAIPEEDRATVAKDWLIGGKTSVERALGVHWFVEDDQLGFQISVKDKPATRRGILSIVSSIYDPLGIASPFVFSAKILLQTLCKSKLNWDDELDEKHLKLWNSWLSQVPELERVRVDRCYKPKGFGNIVSCQLHCFSDASELGTGIVIYLRLTNRNGDIHCAFILGKSRVAPLKVITIPRMELTAATVAVKLSKIISDQLDMQIDRKYYWTDSTSVLKYIANTSMRFHTFVANRLAFIHEATSVQGWNYISSKQNPADCASRGIQKIGKFLTREEWLKGPEFLWKSEQEWPISSGSPVKDLNLSDDPEVKRELLSALLQPVADDPVRNLIQNVSDWWRLKRITAVVLLAIIKFRKIVNKVKTTQEGTSKSGLVSVDLINRAEKFLIQHEQA